MVAALPLSKKSKNQKNYLKNLKENLKPNEAIIILDFAENCSFVVQDAVQGYHWNNSQATLHPFAVYYRGDEGQLCKTNFWIVSFKSGLKFIKM